MQSFTQMFPKNNLMLFVFAIVVGYGLLVLYQYLSSKGVVGYEGNTTMLPSSEVQPHSMDNTTSQFSQIDPGANVSSSMNANVDDLLPQDNNKQWNDLNPVGSTALNGVNLLDAGHHIGTISQVKRNMNLQVRPEPTIPIMNTGPWNNTSMEEVDHTTQLGYRALY